MALGEGADGTVGGELPECGGGHGGIDHTGGSNGDGAAGRDNFVSNPVVSPIDNPDAIRGEYSGLE